MHFEFALGKALEDAASYEESFTHYAAGNALRRSQHGYDSGENSRFVLRSKQLLDRASSSRERAGAGAPARDPIFIVGLPRAGSTLIEQMLASHPLVEGTMELPQLPKIARELAGPRQEEEGTFLKRLAALSHDELRALGERYLAETRIMRKTDAPFFIDKMPNNCMYVGLIHLILPNAVIIDARRHPLGCCFSCFKQHFARGQWFTYGLDDLGRYYRDYVELMAHFDEVLPGRVGRVFYEELIADPETRAAAAARALRAAFRAGVPAVLRERAGGADGELRAGPAADFSGRRSSTGVTTSRGSTRSSRHWVMF